MEFLKALRNHGREFVEVLPRIRSVVEGWFRIKNAAIVIDVVCKSAASLVVGLRKRVTLIVQVSVNEFTVAVLQDPLSGRGCSILKRRERISHLIIIFGSLQAIQESPSDEHANMGCPVFIREIFGEISAVVPRCVVVLQPLTPSSG